MYRGGKELYREVIVISSRNVLFFFISFQMDYLTLYALLSYLITYNHRFFIYDLESYTRAREIVRGLAQTWLYHQLNLISLETHVSKAKDLIGLIIFTLAFKLDVLSVFRCRGQIGGLSIP